MITANMAKLCSDTHTPIAVVDNVSEFLNPEIDSFLQPTMAGFLEKCCIIFCEALKRGIPLRGVVSCGMAIMDEESHIFLGRPLSEAAKAEAHQNWLGVRIGRTINNIYGYEIHTSLFQTF